MSDVFISYSHKDTDVVRQLVPALEAAGLSVWWDHTIPPGKTWDQVIARGIREAKACIIVWTPNSIDSDWVKEEATIAKEGAKYLPVNLGVDQPPLGFRRIQAADLRQWYGDPEHPQWRMLLNEINTLVGDRAAAPIPTPVPPVPAPVPSASLFAWLRAHPLAGVVAGVAVFVLLAILWHGSGSHPAAAFNYTPPAATPAASPGSPAGAAGGAVDPRVVGTFTLDTLFADYNTHYIDQISADGSYVLTGTQLEDGANSGDASGNFRNVGSTGRVHTGNVQKLDDSHFQAGTVVYQLIKAVVPAGQPNPALLGTWTASGSVAGQNWNWTWTSTTPGQYHFEGHLSDRGHASFANGLWTATSAITGQTGGGTYAYMDPMHVQISGMTWTRQQ